MVREPPSVIPTLGYLFMFFFLHSFIFTHTGIVSVEPDLLELDFMPPPLTYFPPLTLEYDLSVSIFFIMVAAYL